jgi:hypothetical protein
MPTVEEIQKLKREVEELKEKIARNQGAIAELKTSATCHTDKSIRRKLTDLQTKRVELEEEWQRLYAEYREKYHAELE